MRALKTAAKSNVYNNILTVSIQDILECGQTSFIWGP